MDLTNGGAPASEEWRAGSSASLLAAEPVSLEQRIIAATLRCVSRWGVAKSTLDDIAREAGCSRATVYRVFPGGKDVVLLAVVRHEMEAVLDDVAAASRAATSVEDLLAIVLWHGVHAVRTHEALCYLVEHEPGVILPWISFDGLDPLLDLVTSFVAPLAERFLDPRSAREAAEALCRLVVAYAFDIDPTAEAVLTGPDDARRLVRTYLVPGLTVPGPD